MKSGSGVNLYSGKRIETKDLEKLMTDNGPLELKKKIGKFHIFEKIEREGSDPRNPKKNFRVPAVLREKKL